MNSKPSLVVATVIDRRFEQGGIAMIHSFFEQNSWFSGKFVVFDFGISNGKKKLISAISNSVEFRPPSDEFLNLARSVESRFPPGSRYYPRLASFDIFSLTDFDRVLFVDSDLLFCKSIARLVQNDKPFVACPDGATIRGNVRNRQTYAEMETTEIPDRTEFLTDTFNSGVMLFDSQLLNEPLKDNFAEVLKSDLWSRMATKHTDQAIWNLIMRDQVTLAGSEFNYLLGHHQDLSERNPGAFDSARVLHFNGASKPWLPEQIQHIDRFDGERKTAFQYWMHVYKSAISNMNY